MRRSKCLAGLVGCLLLMGCGKQIPGDIIQPELMEDVLYDYHLSVSMSDQLRVDEFYKKKALQDYVFQKHGITEAEFDSSMVWYTRHTIELAEIYSNLNKRFNIEEARINRFLDARDKGDFAFLSGDTVDAWPYQKFYWLTTSPFENQFAFQIAPDTTFYPKDAFLWKANYTFLKKGKATMAINVLYDNDSVIGQSKLITESGIDSIYLSTDSTYQVKSINGFIYLDEDSLHKPILIVNDLSLMKYHALDDSLKAIKDSLMQTGTANQELIKPVDNLNRDKLKPIKLKRAQPND